jgi:hypothetical protein
MQSNGLRLVADTEPEAVRTNTRREPSVPRAIGDGVDGPVSGVERTE